jgi:hypothetical protein
MVLFQYQLVPLIWGKGEAGYHGGGNVWQCVEEKDKVARKERGERHRGERGRGREEEREGRKERE